MKPKRWLIFQIHKSLCALLSNRENNNIQIEDENLFMVASQNEIATAIACHVAKRTKWDKVPQQWRRAYDKTHADVSAFMAELDQVSANLVFEGISLVALKNAGIARGIYQHPGACPMGDLDVLVDRRHFRKAHQILLDNGYHFEFRSELEEEDLDEAENGGGAEYWKILPSGEKLWFELQWRPVAGRWIRPDQEPSAEELMARSIPIEGTHVRLLAPEDNLMQVCLHTAKHTYVRAPGFRLHLDVERIVRAYPDLDWPLFVERIRRAQVRTATYFSLKIPFDLFDTPIPEWVLEELKPSLWKEYLITKWIQKAGLFNPHEKKFGRVKYIHFNALLYDDFGGLLRGIFPEANWMRTHYQFQNRLLLPYFHIQRIMSLLFRRLAT